MKLEFKRREEPFVFEVMNESGANCIIDASHEVGGKNKGLRPMELLASSLAGCLSIDLLLILKKRRKSPKTFSIEIDAVREEGTLANFKEINFNILIDDDLDTELLDKNINLVLEKYCSVSASLNENIELNYTINQR